MTGKVKEGTAVFEQRLDISRADVLPVHPLELFPVIDRRAFGYSTQRIRRCQFLDRQDFLFFRMRPPEQNKVVQYGTREIPAHTKLFDGSRTVALAEL